LVVKLAEESAVKLEEESAETSAAAWVAASARVESDVESVEGLVMVWAG
jgi:hypothetical protein